MTSSVPCFDPETAKVYPGYDMARAKSVLQAAGYVAGSNGILAKDGKPLADGSLHANSRQIIRASDGKRIFVGSSADDAGAAK